MAKKKPKPKRVAPKTMGQVAYEGYSGRTNGISPFSLKQLPPWKGVPWDVKKSWEEAARKVGEVLLAAGLIQSVPELPDTPEVDEVEPSAASVVVKSD